MSKRVPDLTPSPTDLGTGGPFRRAATSLKEADAASGLLLELAHLITRELANLIQAHILTRKKNKITDIKPL